MNNTEGNTLFFAEKDGLAPQERRFPRGNEYGNETAQNTQRRNKTKGRRHSKEQRKGAKCQVERETVVFQSMALTVKFKEKKLFSERGLHGIFKEKQSPLDHGLNVIIIKERKLFSRAGPKRDF